MTELIDTISPSDEFIFNIFGAIAQFEKQRIVERINLGLNRARKGGKQLGGKKVKNTEELGISQGIIKGGVKILSHQK